MAGVSENILMGQLVPVGTGAFSLLIDEEKLAGAWRSMAPACTAVLQVLAGWLGARQGLVGWGWSRALLLCAPVSGWSTQLPHSLLSACVHHPTPTYPTRLTSCCLQMPLSWTMP